LREGTLDIVTDDSFNVHQHCRRMAANVVHVPVTDVMGAGSDTSMAVDSAESTFPQRTSGVTIAARWEAVLTEGADLDGHGIWKRKHEDVGPAVSHVVVVVSGHEKYAGSGTIMLEARGGLACTTP
jgi:hypothetical protein